MLPAPAASVTAVEPPDSVMVTPAVSSSTSVTTAAGMNAEA